VKVRHIAAVGIILLLAGCIAQEGEQHYYTFPTYYSGCEIQLIAEFKKAALLEPDISEDDILAVINRFHRELSTSPDLHLLPPIMIAFLLDPVTYDIYEELQVNPSDTADTAVHTLQVYAQNHMTHTQQLPVFAHTPGHDPWGTVLISGYRRAPTYKYVLPSEMRAMSIFSGKITGKCSSLAMLNGSLFRLMGAEGGDVLLVRVEGHTFGLARYKGTLYEFNNTVILPVSNPLMRSRFTSRRFLGVYNEWISTDKNLTIIDEVLDSQDSLVDALWRAYWESEPPSEMRLPDTIQRHDIVSLVFGESNVFCSHVILAKYAYQSLYVKKPELYLKASLRSPRAVELSTNLESIDEIIDWIQTNVATGSIFEDHHERIMLADQVIVFKTGGLKDQAVLAFTLLTLKGYNPVITITADTAYIEVEHRIYDVKGWSIVDSVTGTAELILRL